MHIFLVNDDGIGSNGIMALVQAAAARGHRVSMCAPASQQSAASQRITLAEPLYVSDYPVEHENVTAYSIGGTPTDCVRLGLFDLVKEPVDVLISGINDGHNSGMAVHYSGTVGAAREGVRNRIPSIAASMAYQAGKEALEYFAGYVIQVAEKYVTLELPPFVMLNINAPDRSPKELLPPVLAPLSTANYIDSYIRRESPRAGVYYWMEGGFRTEVFSEGTDQDMLEKGHITLSFIGEPMDHNPECKDFSL